MSSVGPDRAPFDSWADFYDLTDADRGASIDFYRRLVTDQTRSLLELGCGTGTITIALATAMQARTGGPDTIRVVGLDQSREMLRVARSRDPHIDWVLGDMRAPNIDGPFDLVISPFNTLQYLLRDEDLAQAFRSVRHLISDRGIFAFDIYQPNPEYLANPQTDRLARSVTDPDGRRLEIREDTSYDPDSLVLTVNWRLVETDDGRPPLASTTHRMRQFAAADVDRILAEAGLEGRERYGGLDRSPFTGASKKQVVVCGTAGEERIPVLRPRLPATERLVPYLRRIDARRIYTNWGPLSAELERRLERRLELSEGCVSSAGSGTAALAGGVLASAGRATSDRPLAIVPALTFVATVSAVEQCGYVPFLADIDPHTWTLDPTRIAAHTELERVGVIVPVAPFGRPVPLAPWREFRRSSGIPVVIDGAASFDRLTDAPAEFLGDVPVAISFHATKSFGVGEGGCLASTDPDLILRAGQALNFGFHGTRDSRGPSINGKLSEYHAAVGLAELDGWGEKHEALRRVGASYRRHAGEAGLGDRVVTSPEISAAYVLFRCVDAAEAARVRAALTDAGVGYRLWYGVGLHRQSHFASGPRERLDVTDAVAPCLLGIPQGPDLAEATVAEVVAALAEGVG